jgi:glycosyltransferase involved in cell wall biosynthesis
VLFVSHLPAELDGLVVTAEAHRRGIPIGLVHHTGRSVDQIPVFARARAYARLTGAVHARGLDDLLGPNAVDLGNGVDIDFFDPSRVDRKGLFRERHPEIGERSSLIVAPGSIKERKRQNDVIEAARILVEEHGLSDFQIAFIGEVAEPAFRRRLDRQISDCRLGDKVVFIDHLSEEELRQAYADADVGVLVSRFEGRPRVVLEMGAMGLPVVVTDADGSRDCFIPGASGFLVPVFHPRIVAEALRTLLKDSHTRRQFGSVGSAFVRERHSLRDLSDRHADFYRRIMSTASERRPSGTTAQRSSS